MLGSGGNDGRFEASSIFLKCVKKEILDGDPHGEAQLEYSLFGNITKGKRLELANSRNNNEKQMTAGFFHPGAYAGIATGPDGSKKYTIMNPWDYILAMEGVVFFAGSVSRRGNRGWAAFPFSMSASWAGYDTACDNENSGEKGSPEDRGEIWFPLWNRPATYDEIRYAFREGRVQIGKKLPATGIGFAVALTNLGAMRGFTAFQRFGMFKRKGAAYHAVGIGKIRTGASANAKVLPEVEKWLERIRSNKEKPKSMEPLLRAADDAIIRYCVDKRPVLLQRVLIAIGRLEAHPKLPQLKKRVQPLVLSPGWIEACKTNTAEFRLAASLAAMTDGKQYPIRRNLEPVAISKKSQVEWKKKNTSSVWGRRSTIQNMISILERRCIDGLSTNKFVPLRSFVKAPVADVMRFIEGDIDYDIIRELLFPLSLVRYESGNLGDWGRDVWRLPNHVPESYICVKANFPPVNSAEGNRGVFEPSLIGLLKSGKSDRATQIARRRLQIAGYAPATYHSGLSAEEWSPYMTHRFLASMIFPLRDIDIEKMIQWLKVPAPRGR